MNVFLGEVAKKFADHWGRFIVLPGLLYLAVLVIVSPLSQWRPGIGFWDALRVLVVPSHLRELARTLIDDGAVVVVAAAAVVVLGSLLFGQVAIVLAHLVERVWLGDWPAWAAGPLTRARLKAWQGHEQRETVQYAHARDPDEINKGDLMAVRARKHAISLAEPQCPTWMGDRVAAVETLVDRSYHVPLRDCWPRLWMSMPDRGREDVQAGARDFHAQTTLAGWGVLYLVTTVYWWPAVFVALVVLITAWRRGRTCLSQFAALLESAVDLYGADLGRALGLTVDGPLTPTAGEEIRARVVKNE